MSGGPCDRCSRKIWDPVKGGYLLCCYGHFDGGTVFVSHERKRSFRVKACSLFLEDEKPAKIPKIDPEILHKRGTAKGCIDTTIEGFF